MSPNGRKAWRKWAKARRRWLNMDERRYRDPYEDEPLIKHRYAWFEAKKQFGPKLVCPKAKPFTSRSLVGMTQGARKRAIRRVLRSEMPSCYRIPGAFYRIGERLRPCLGCCACWGADVSPAGFGYDAECFGPRVTGRAKRERSRMWKWQRNLVDDCDGSGVLPARKDKT